MRRYVIAAASLLAFAACGPARATTQIFAYEGAGCSGVANLAQFTALTGRKLDGAADFLDYTSTWANLLGATNWGLGCWQGNVANLSLAVPMAVADNDGKQLQEVAAGDYNTYFKQIAQSLVSHGFPYAYIRLGWEFNGGWYPWAANSSPSLWVQGFQQAVATMRSVPGQHFTFVWNPSLYQQQFAPSAAYPGDSYVDVIATDAYNVSYDYGYTVPGTRWNSINNDSWGIAQVVAFAKQHKKPYAFPEWGTGTSTDGHGGGDDPMFMANMAPYVSGSLYSAYWDCNCGGYNSQLSGSVSLVGAMAAAMGEYGSSTAGSKSSVAVERNVGAIMERGATPFVAAPLPVTATGGYATAVQNGPYQYNVVVWTAGDVAGAVNVNLGTKVASAALYNPSVSATPVQTFGAITGATVTLKAGQPMILTVKK